MLLYLHSDKIRSYHALFQDCTNEILKNLAQEDSSDSESNAVEET